MDVSEFYWSLKLVLKYREDDPIRFVNVCECEYSQQFHPSS